MKKVYIVEDNSEHADIVFATREAAVDYMEKMTGKKESEWFDCDADYCEDSDDMIFIKEAEFVEE